MRHNPVKAKIARGEPSFGIWFWPVEATPNRVEYYGHLGFEFAIIDLQAMPANPESIRELIRACDVVGLVPIVRPRSQDKTMLLSYLEMGAMGLIVPGVQTAEQTRAIVDAVKYAPTRGGGVSGVSRAGNWGLTQSNYEHRTQANAETMIILITDPVGYSNLDEILDVEDVDVVCVWSPTSFNRYLGHEEADNPEGLQMALEGEAKIAARGVGFDTSPNTVAEAREAIQRGARLIGFCDPDAIAPMFRSMLDDLRTPAAGAVDTTAS